MQEVVEDNVGKGVWKPTEQSDWATPIVSIVKPDGSVRLCGHYKVTVNKQCLVDPYPKSRIEDIFAELRGGQLFSKIDLHSVYSQVPVHDESLPYLTVNTHLGLFKVKRLPFGVNAAVGIFQSIVSGVLKGLDCGCVYLVDVLITGRDVAEHLHNIQLVLERLKRGGPTIKKRPYPFSSHLLII